MMNNQLVELRKKYIQPVSPVQNPPLSKQSVKDAQPVQKVNYEFQEDELAAFGVDDTMTVGEVLKKLAKLAENTN